ncbi:Thioredoxin [Petrocella atlantisensis]|uniref:Thioredoxin n=1 Tax=Petrocella atlantisensis TaxID=2173034 RepID=A0A3P7NW90_9FIRM|nr:thioredoxin family protein [Petrocella atlantisensis]MCF8019299.1 thioredoxin family protein [Vallitaleaceae bacterium]PKM53272.1 MAG: redox-active disulfide protein 2 [Firmicutes bacterium HGW-Firmicutes-5]VDN47464.1 Thioredoxin [Petrocella atlantisensis]
MEIKVLGPGCKNCTNLEANTKKALAELNIEATVEKVTDMKEIIGYGVMSTPALVVDGTLKVMGRVPKPSEIKEYLV